MSLVAALVAVQVPVSFWEKASPWIFVASLLLLVVVLIPGIGKGVNGARRWIPLGLLNFQPSELAKRRDRDVRRQLHGAQDGHQGEVLPRGRADGGRARRRRACCCWPSPTWARSW